MLLTGKYLFSTETFSSREARVISITVLIFWWIILLIGVNHHEFWRDEVHLLTVALEPRSILGIFGAVKDIGHPVVWPLLLRFFHTILDSSLALPIVSTGVAFAGVFFFYFLSPFSNWQKIFFIFGVLPIYQYSVVARNYGLAMPLLFLFAHFYRTRKDNPLVLATLLFLLANTSAHACLIAAVLCLMWMYEYFSGGCEKLASHLTGFGLVVLGGLIAIVTTLPGSDNAVTSVASSGLGFGQLIGVLFENFLHPAQYYVTIFPKASPLIRDLVFWALFAGLCVTPIRAVGLLLGAIFLGTFFTLFVYVHIRHEGIFVLFVITLYWITVTEENFSAPIRQWINRWVACIGLGGIFAVHLILGGQAIWGEVSYEQSSVKRLARYISEFSPDAILMPEPDYIFEAFPYYANNEIYLIREKKYAKRAQPTIHIKFDLNLNELIEQAQMLEQKRQKKVLIVLGHLDLGSRANKQVEFPYGKKFSWTSESLKKFIHLTEKVAEFKFSGGIENFEVYRLKE
jgi:hypothetical protein